MLKSILESYGGDEEGGKMLVVNGFDDAVIGIATDFTVPRLIYSVSKCIDILINSDGMSDIDAMEYFTFNISGGWLGEFTPIWCWDDYE